MNKTKYKQNQLGSISKSNRNEFRKQNHYLTMKFLNSRYKK